MSLCCLVYTSISNQKMPDDDLKDLLKQSRARNKKSNITGLLLYLDPFFLQILEGEEAIVNELFNKIKQDTRHHKVRIIYKKPVQTRHFPYWTMGFNKINDETLKSTPGFSDFWQRSTSEFFSDSPDEIEKNLKELLDMFKDETLF